MKVPELDQVGSPLVGSPLPVKNRNQEDHQVMKAEIHQRTGAKVLELYFYLTLFIFSDYSTCLW